MKRALLNTLLCLSSTLLLGQADDFWTSMEQQKGSHTYVPVDRRPANITEYEKEARGISGSSVSTLRPEPWPADSNIIEAKTLPFEGTVPTYSEDGNDFSSANGRRVFAFLVQPGEKVAFNMKAEDDKVALRAHVPSYVPSLKWKMDLRYANIPARARRSKRLEVKNSSPEPQTLILIVYGVSGYSYHLELARSGGPKQG